LPRLRAFFASALINTSVEAHDGWFSFEGVPLKWHYFVGLLYDLFSGNEPVQSPEDGASGGQDHNNGPHGSPWRLIVHFTEWPESTLIRLDEAGEVLHDVFKNVVKEADFLRNGSAKVVMGLSKDDSTALWAAVEQQNLPLFNSINNKLLNPPGTSIRHVPVKVYLPTATHANTPDTAAGSLRVVQSLVTPLLPSKQPQTLGIALNALLPSVFPSRRNAILAQATLHGTVVPLGAIMEDLMRAAAYPDGFLHIAVVMMS
jgi:autophagy-related protein 5